MLLIVPNETAWTSFLNFWKKFFDSFAYMGHTLNIIMNLVK